MLSAWGEHRPCVPSDGCATVACVLRSGGPVYTERWVRALYFGVQAWWYCERRLDFVCLTDLDLRLPGVRTVPLRYDWPGWWAKLELFRPDLFEGAVVALDLDTLPVGRLDWIARHSLEFAMLSDFWQPDEPQSGVLAWMPGQTSERVWRAFSEAPDQHMATYAGDGQFIADVVGPGVPRLQTLYPHKIVGFKVRRPLGIIPGPPEGASLICAHGVPRFSEPAADWAHVIWASRAGVELGWRTRPERWASETVYIVGGGPSAGEWELEKLDGLVVAVNDSGRMLPGADVLFTADLSWVQRRTELIAGWRGDVVVAMPKQPGRHRELVDAIPARCHRVPRERDHNSGEEALRWVANMGARRVVLIGFDLDRPAHWHGGYGWTYRPEMAPEVRYRQWVEHFAETAQEMAARGVEVYNANPRSAIRSFPFIRLSVPRRKAKRRKGRSA